MLRAVVVSLFIRSFTFDRGVLASVIDELRLTTIIYLDGVDYEFDADGQVKAAVNGLPRVPTSDSQSPPASATPSATSMSTPSARAAASGSGVGRKTAKKNATMSVEEAARLTADEDKRRRNTAASARFRVKKKQREQALEKTVKETADKNDALEARVSQLELENRWLKNLITEKNGGASSSSLDEHRSEAEVAEMFKKFLASQKTTEGAQRTDSRLRVGGAL